jgi:rhomboid protease GluP
VFILFIRTESFQQFIRYYPIITWIIGINTFLFLLSFLLPEFYHYNIQVWGIGFNKAIWNGEYWRLITPIFLHSGFAHFAFNSFALIIFGPALERIFGKIKFIGLYFFAGLCGNVATLFLGELLVPHLGASGAIYGLLGIYLYMRFYRKDLLDSQSAQIVTIYLVIGAVSTFIVPNVNIWGHLFGFIGGLALGPILLKSK